MKPKTLKSKFIDWFTWIKKSEFVELKEIDCSEDPVRPELDLEFRTSYGRKIYGLKYDNKIEGGFIFNTSYLKDKIGELHKNKEVKVTMGGDDNLSQMVLVPIEKLFKD